MPSIDDKETISAAPYKKQIFIIGSGRSGTTLVQRLFNSFPNTMVWGEHAGFLKEISEAYFTLTQDPKLKEHSYSQKPPDASDEVIDFYKRPERWQAWNNWFQPEDINGIFRQYLESIFSPSSLGESVIWGFKEIRYGRNDRVIEFLAELYPEAEFVFVARNGLNTLESQLTTFRQGESKYLTIKRILQLPTAIKMSIIWSKQNRHFMKLLDSNKENFHLVHFEKLTVDIHILAPILNKLGLELGETQFKIIKMKEGRGSGLDEGLVDQRWKRLGLIPSFIAEVLLGATNEQLGYSVPKHLIIARSISKIVT